ncbi:hypothetical protein B0H10DRAFT_2047473, partial [Mycena sp. CBHHK59/15]
MAPLPLPFTISTASLHVRPFGLHSSLDFYSVRILAVFYLGHLSPCIDFRFIWLFCL